MKNGKGMTQETYYHINKYIGTLDLDLVNGAILNRKVTSLHSGGYPLVTLAGKTVKQHQIFAVARWGEKCISMTINHINEIKHDNSWDNLELLSQEENNAVRTKKGGSTKQQTKAINLDTCEELIFESIREASQQLGLHQQNIGKVLRGERKRAGRYTFESIGTYISKQNKQK